MSDVIALQRHWCWPWHLAFMARTVVRGADCRLCGRAIAAPLRVTGLLACLYCAMDRGWIPAAEVEPDPAA